MSQDSQVNGYPGFVFKTMTESSREKIWSQFATDFKLQIEAIVGPMDSLKFPPGRATLSTVLQ